MAFETTAGPENPTGPIPLASSCIVGAGAVGLALAIALARGGVATILVGPSAPPRAGRTVALLEGSVRLLIDLDVWPRLAGSTAALRGMRLVDATNSLFRPPPVTFDAREIGLPAFGFNVENGVLESVLREAALETPGLTMVDDTAVGMTVAPSRATVRCASGLEIDAALVIAADGRQSRIRKLAGIGVRERRWPQAALTTSLSHDADHRNISTEFHTREGPFTLVPLAAAAGRHRSSLVWVMRPELAEQRRSWSRAELSAAIEHQSQRLLGRLEVDGPVGCFPIATSTSARVVAPRLALIGEAAHALPPIGAQGINLSLRDVRALAAELLRARSQGEDLGSERVLERFARARRTDVALRTLGVDTLNGSLLADNPVTDALRGLGLGALGSLGPMRRWIMRHGLAPEPDRGATPPLTSGPAFSHQARTHR